MGTKKERKLKERKKEFTVYPKFPSENDKASDSACNQHKPNVRVYSALHSPPLDMELGHETFRGGTQALRELQRSEGDRKPNNYSSHIHLNVTIDLNREWQA